jgi:hypothetical protein
MFQYTVEPGHCSEETVGNLRQRLNVMREIVKVSIRTKTRFDSLHVN